MPTELKNNIIMFKDTNEKFMDILSCFNVKIKFLSYKLKYPEAETDLIIYLFELLKTLNIKRFKEDKEILAYVNTCLKNKSIYLHNKNNNYTDKVALTPENEILDYININEQTSDYSNVFFKNLISTLKPKYRKIIFYKFYLQLSDIEISKIFNISRQAVNKNKRKALKDLKKQLLT